MDWWMNLNTVSSTNNVTAYCSLIGSSHFLILDSALFLFPRHWKYALSTHEFLPVYPKAGRTAFYPLNRLPASWPWLRRAPRLLPLIAVWKICLLKTEFPMGMGGWGEGGMGGGGKGGEGGREQHCLTPLSRNRRWTSLAISRTGGGEWPPAYVLLAIF